MTISIIVAVDRQRGIGKDGDLPWRLPADLKHFKRTTMGHPIVMGRKTHESIGKALPSRTNIVATRQHDYTAEGCVIVDSFENAIAAAQADDDEVMIVGGASIYEAALPHTDRIYLTVVDGDFDTDTFFPALEPNTWTVVDEESHEADEKNAHPYTFYTLERGASLPDNLRFLVG
jgi:dihydrofolate reductase